jgi:putrescine transport system permease protein
MVLPLYASLERLDRTLIEAALDLGSTPLRAFWTIRAPLSMPGIVAGSLLCFIPIVGEFVVPDLLGGSETLMIGRTLWSEFFSNRDWPLASAVAIVLLVILVVPIVLYREAEARRLEAGR